MQSVKNTVDRRRVANIQSATGFDYNYAGVTAGWARIWVVVAIVFLIIVAGGIISWTALRGHTRKAEKPPTSSSTHGNVRTGTGTGTTLKGTKLQGGFHLAVQMSSSAPVLLGQIAYMDPLLDLPPYNTTSSVGYSVTVRNYGKVPLAHVILNISVTPPPTTDANYTGPGLAPGLQVFASPNEVPVNKPPYILPKTDRLYCPYSYIPVSGKIACRNSLMDPGATLHVEFTIGFGQLPSSQPPPPPSVTITAAVTATTRGGKVVKSTAPPVSTKIIPADVNTTLQVTSTVLPELSPSAKFPALEVTLTNHSSTEPIYQVILTAPDAIGPPGGQPALPGANDFPKYVCQGEPLGDITEICGASPSGTLAPGASETMVFELANDSGCAPPSGIGYPYYQAVGLLASGKVVYANYC